MYHLVMTCVMTNMCRQSMLLSGSGQKLDPTPCFDRCSYLHPTKHDLVAVCRKICGEAKVTDKTFDSLTFLHHAQGVHHGDDERQPVGKSVARVLEVHAERGHNVVVLAGGWLEGKHPVC